MDHVVYVDAKLNELENLLNEEKNMIIRGAAGRKLPYGRVKEGGVLYFINNNGEGLIKAQAIVSFVFNSRKMSFEESVALVEQYQDRLKLTSTQFSKWAGKRYIVLIGIQKIMEITPFLIDKSAYGNMDD
jgi:hypothetical protein